jgi:4-hydroxy-tetrahydrodipicolinate synthase
MILEKSLKNYKLGIFLLYCNTLRFSIYNKPTQEGIYQHFKSDFCFANSDYIYNVQEEPSNMLPKTVVRLANDFQNIVACQAAGMVQAM